MLTPSQFRFQQYGQTGNWFSELVPNIATHADELCWLRGLHTDTPAHPQAVVQLHTGSANAALTRPSIGAWLLYGLGSENQDLPGYITINPSPNFGGAVNYGSAFLPAHYQGTRINDAGFLPNLKAATPPPLQREQLDLIQAMNHDLAARAGRSRRRGRDHPVLRTRLPDARQSARAARPFAGAPKRSWTPTESRPVPTAHSPASASWRAA